MREYRPEELRNVVLVGHGGCGKTTLSEVMLYDAGAISRLGRVEDRNTVSDYDEEEQSRGLSVNLTVLPLEWQDRKLNIVDAPGYMDFVGEVKTAIRATDGAVLIICASSGVEVGAEMHWAFLDEAQIPRLVFLNKMDRDNASFARTLEQLRDKFDKTFVPVESGLFRWRDRSCHHEGLHGC
jgi:elongation factor G